MFEADFKNEPFGSFFLERKTVNYKRTMVLIEQLKENPEKWELVEDLFLVVKRAVNTVKIKTLKSSRLTPHSITERVNNYSMHYKGAIYI